MTTEALAARNRIAALKRDLASAEANLASIERTCQHEFGAVVSNPIVRPGYTEPGDAPGTMGIDHRSSFYVPEQVTPRWTRTCTVCGKVEETTQTTPTTTYRPKF